MGGREAEGPGLAWSEWNGRGWRPGRRGHRSRRRTTGPSTTRRRRACGPRSSRPRTGCGPSIWEEKKRKHLDIIAPATGQLAGSFAALDAGVHRQNPLVSEELGDELTIWAQHIIVESTRRKGQYLGLRFHRLEDLWMAMALIDSRIGGEEIVIFLAINVPNLHSLTFGKHDLHLIFKSIFGKILIIKTNKDYSEPEEDDSCALHTCLPGPSKPFVSQKDEHVPHQMHFPCCVKCISCRQRARGQRCCGSRRKDVQWLQKSACLRLG